MGVKDQAGLSRATFGVVFAVSLASAIGTTGLVSVVPAIGRSIGIPDTLVAAIFSLSAVMWALTSPLWARASDARGRKPMILLGLAGFAVSMLLCGLTVSAGLAKLAPPLVIFGLFLGARGIFGLIGSAMNPAAQAYVVERTPADKRTQQLASLAGALGLGTVVGPSIAPLFILPGVGLAGPLYAFSILAAAMFYVVLKFLPERKIARAKEATAAPVRATPMWRNPDVRPFLIYGFLVASCQNAQAQTLGFLIIDKLNLSPTAAQGMISIAMTFGAVAGLLAQWGLIRMFEMTPRQLLRWGVAVAAAGNLLVAFAPGYAMSVGGYALASVGFGLARPGFTAGASLAVSLADQARVAGAIAAVNGLNVVLAPFFVQLYERFGQAPFLLNVAILLALLVYAMKNRALKNADPSPATRAQAAMATLESREEGSPT